MSNDGVSIVIPTLNGGEVFAECIAQIRAQKYIGQVQLIIIDSGSTDNTVEIASGAGALVKQIKKKDFHHAGTRNLALEYIEYNKVIYTVQDAVPLTKTWVVDLVRALDENNADAAFGKQIPHDDASIYARFEVGLHNEHLGDTEDIQFLKDGEKLCDLPYHEILRKIRLDDVCAIYKTDVLKKSPFPMVRFGEDMAWAFENMQKGARIIYVPGVSVKHSHNRTAEYRFKRGIVDAVNCAEIIGKTDTTMLFSMRDIVLLAYGISEKLDEVKQEIESWYQKGGAYHDSSREVDSKQGFGGSVAPSVMKWILSSLTLSFVDRFRIIVIRQVCKRHNLIPYAFSQLPPATVAEEIRRHFFMIKEESEEHLLARAKSKESNFILKEDLIEIFDQVVAGFIARIFGVTYASHSSQGTVSPKMDRLIVPYLEDV